MHFCILILVYIHYNLLHVLPIHVAIFKEVKYTEWKHYKV